jgi:hypothetical protein
VNGSEGAEPYITPAFNLATSAFEIRNLFPWEEVADKADVVSFIRAPMYGVAKKILAFSAWGIPMHSNSFRCRTAM